MAPLAVLLVASVVARGLGRLGIAPLSTWRSATRAGAAVMFGFTGTTHFSSMKADYAAMVPGAVPPPVRQRLVEVTGVLQLAGAAGLLIPRARRLAGVALCALLVAMFPANVAAARAGVPFRGRPATSLWLRAPVQALYLAVLAWSAVTGDAGPRRRSVWSRLTGGRAKSGFRGVVG
jgi:uncharacterized membrane protein